MASDMSKMGFRGSDMMPITEAIIEFPDLLLAPKGRVIRVFRRAATKALKDEMLFHHKKRIPEHFNKWRQGKYRYQSRSERTRLMKTRSGQADLVKSGRTKREVTSRIRITNPRGSGGGVFIKGWMRWPAGFSGDDNQYPQKITTDVMVSEITRWTLREERVATEHIGVSVKNQLDDELSVRAKRQVKKTMGLLGIKVP